MCNDGTLLLLRALLRDITDDEIKSLQTVAQDAGKKEESKDSSSTDAIIYKGTIITMAGGKFSTVDAMAVQGDTIVSTGTEAQVKADVSHMTSSERDLGSQCIVPGFIEPHLHLLPTTVVELPEVISLWYSDVQTITQAIDTIQQAAKKAGPGSWVVGFGYDPALIQDHVQLTLDITDAAASDNPFFVGNPSGHLGYANTKAFHQALIGTHEGDIFPFPKNDPYYVKNAAGDQLTGVVLEKAVSKLSHVLPKHGIKELSWTQAGCTTVFDAGIGQMVGLADVEILKVVLKPDAPNAQKNPNFGGAIAIDAVKDIIGLAPELKKPPITIGNFSVYTIKYWLDGSTQGFTAAVPTKYSSLTPFPDAPYGMFDYRTDNKVLGSPPNDAGLVEVLRPALEAGWQAMLHVNGGAAVAQALRVLSQFPPPTTYMHRLEHFTADVTAEQITAVKQLGASVSHLIAHVRSWGQAFIDYIFQDVDRAGRIDPVADELEAGLVYSFHSDSFVSLVNPLQYVDTAVTREMQGGGVLGPSQVISLEQALCGVTINPAIQLGKSSEIGTLEAKKKADFVILSVDPRSVPDGTLHQNCTVVQTWVNGKLAYGS